MESQILEERVEWEARRHAIAFGLSGWNVIGCDIESETHYLSFLAYEDDLWFECGFSLDAHQEYGFSISDFDLSSRILCEREHDVFAQLHFAGAEAFLNCNVPPGKTKLALEVTARLVKAVYFLGHLTDDDLERKMGRRFSQHEKMELRLSL